MVAKPDLLKLMLTDPQRRLDSNLPSFAQKLLGLDAITALHGKAHTTLYALGMRSMSTRFHENWMACFDEVIKRTVDSWKGRTMNCYGELFANTAFVYMFGTFNSDKELTQKLTQWNPTRAPSTMDADVDVEGDETNDLEVYRHEVLFNWYCPIAGSRVKFTYDNIDLQWIDLESVITIVSLKMERTVRVMWILDSNDRGQVDEFVASL
ncbi:hypothetical protein R1flu_027064 [Riccia fluitans]|uniref:Uncharacterized protein n=1 Tax=Riccia fluitans TaxID=41844 RepID=A0ABD1XKN3_9MARC